MRRPLSALTALVAIAAFGLVLGLATPARAQPKMPATQCYTGGFCPSMGVVLLDQTGKPIGSNVAASSTPCVVSATTTASTVTGCNSAGSAGAYTFGPFVPQAGYPVRLVSTGVWAGSMAVGTSVDSCATVNPLTVAGTSWGTYTGNANEAVDVPPTTGGVAYCLSVTVTSGTLNAALRQ